MKTILPAQKEAFLKLKKEYQQANHNYIAGTEPPAEKPAVNTDPYQDPAYLEAKKAVFALHKELEAKYGTGKVPAEELALFNTLKDKATYALNVAMDKVGKPPAEKPVVNTDPYKDPTVVKLKAALDDAENALHKKFDDPYSDAAFQSPEYQTVEKANIAYLEALDAASNKLNIHQPMDKPAEHKSMEDAFDTLSPDDPIFKSNEAAPLTEKDPGYWFDKILALKAEIRAKHGLGEYADVTPYLTEPEQQQLAELKKQYNIALGNGAMLQDTPKPLMLDEWTNAAKPASAPKKKSLLDRWNEHNGDKEPEATPDDLHRWNDTELSRTVRSAIEDGDGKRALLAFAATTKNAGYRTIARALLKLDLRPSIEFFDHEGKHAGSFDSKQNHLTFDPNAVSERTFLHEWVHAATSWAWNHNSKLNATQKAAKKELDDIFDTLRNKYPELVNEYGLRHNTKEMIAEAFTNPRFQELLKDIQLERNARHSDRGMFRHLWDKFVHSLARFLHIDDKSALADILNTSVELFHNPAEPLPQTQTRAFKQWFGKSVVVDEYGNPKIWFHGTAQDIHSFRAKQAGAIFVTKSPRFAGNFADMSRDWMERNYKDVLTPDQIAAAEQDAIKAIHEHYAPTKWRDYKPDELKPFIDDAVWAVKHNPRSSDFMMEAVRNHMPSRENIIPLFVRAEKPFDFENPAHVDAMVKEYNRYNVPMRDTMIDDIRAGNWSTIERKDVQAAIRKLGFDGFYMGEAGEKNLAVYSQTQLKSATGNRGSFDRKNPDIDYATGDYIDSTTAEPKRGPTERMARAVTGLRGKNLGDAKTMGKYVWDAIQQGGFDHMWGATRFKPNQNATEIVNGKRRITWGAALQYMGYAPQLSAESIPRGGVAMNAEGMFHVVDNPQVNQRVLTEKVEALNAPPGVDKWRVANGLAVNARYAEIEANIKKANAFLPPNQQKPLPPRPAGVTDTTLRQFWQDYRTEPSVKEFLDVIKGINDQNILTLEQGQVISPETAKAWRQNKFYVPLQRIMDEDADLGHVHHYGGARTKEVKKFKGSERDVNDVYENLIRQRLWAVDAAMRNEASLRALKDLEGIPLAGTTRLPAQPHNMHNVVMVKEAGEKVYYKVDDPLAYRSFVGIADAFTSPFFRGMEAFTHLLRNMVMLSPDAIFRNMARDVMDAKLYGYLDKNIVQSTREITGQMAASLPHIVREARGGPQYHPRYGITQFGVTGKREYTSLEKEVDRVIREQMRGAPATDWAAWTDKAVGSVIHAWEHVALEAELATRNRVYEQTLARTGSEAEAAMAAINTIDFRRRGDWQAVTLAKKLIPFFNSSLQGFYKIVRAAQGDGMGANVGAHGAAKALALKGMQMMAVASLYNAAMADNEDYKAVKKEIRDNNILIPLPGDGMFMKIPLPFELGALFWSIPSNAIDTMFRDQTGREFLGALWSITKHQLPGAGVQVAKPTVEVLTNHDFFTGKPIESATQQQLAGHERYNDNTSEVAKALGGDTLSPLKVDKLINGYFGSIGAFAVGLADSLVNVVADAKPAKPLNKAPGLRSVVTDPLSSAHVDKFYELADMSHEVYATVKKLLAEGRAEEARTYLAKEGPTGVPNATLYGMNSSMQATARWLAEMRRREHQIATLPPEQMSPEMKRIQIEQMKRAVNDAMKKAMPSYRKASGE